MFTQSFFQEAITILNTIDAQAVENMAARLLNVRERGGRLFVLGVGGSAGSASHAVNDFRKICGFEAYCPTDNVSELTARTNDDGFETVFVQWLKGSRLNSNDAVLVFSVGGGNLEKNISANLIHAVDHAKEIGATVLGVVGRDGGHTAQKADAVVLIPVVNVDHVTPHTEAFHGVIWHLLVTHPMLKSAQTKWEGQK